MMASNTTSQASDLTEQVMQLQIEHLSLEEHAAAENHIGAPARAPEPPFRFLDLPAELRLMVYETIELNTHYDRASICHIFIGPLDTDCEGDPRVNERGGRLELCRSQFDVDTSILAACRQIKAEAQPIFDEKFKEIMSKPVRFHLVPLAAAQLVSVFTTLHDCFAAKIDPPTYWDDGAGIPVLRACPGDAEYHVLARKCLMSKLTPAEAVNLVLEFFLDYFLAVSIA
jgi:hypothetical protein